MHAFRIVHDMPGRMRIRYGRYAFDDATAIGLSHAFKRWEMVYKVEVNAITGSVLFFYEQEKRDFLIQEIHGFSIATFQCEPYMEAIQEQQKYALMKKEIVQQSFQKFRKVAIRRFVMRLLLPLPFRRMYLIIQAMKYFKKGIHSLQQGRVDVPVLDATSIGVSMLSGDFKTTKNIMFLLAISSLLEEYTKKNTTLQLKESLSLRMDKVWILEGEEEIEIPAYHLKKGDIVIIQTGSMIPIDGEITKGTALINESSFTGEPLSKAVGAGNSVFAGTVVEEGKIFVCVRNLQSESRISRIVDMIETNESVKASIQSKADHLADAIVPYSFLGFLVVLVVTRTIRKATSVLLVDYSCAIKLTTSISIISAMREASKHAVMVKGGKYVEAMADADTIVFDKTGTLTKARPVVQQVVPLQQYTRDEVLKMAACLEEHFPHSVANAIVTQAAVEGLQHKEEHTEVKYIIAHGIATVLHGKKVIIGSDHFVFEDEQIVKTKEVHDKINKLHEEGANSLIYLAVGENIAGIISIYDPLKDEAKQVIQQLRKVGFKKIIMLTGDSENAAQYVANKLDIDEYKAGMLPEDKAVYIKRLQKQGRNVVMVGDGVNDTPALSSANVSISMQDSSDIARELADVTLVSGSLEEIVVFRQLSQSLMKRISYNYTSIVSFNSFIIISALFGVILPSTSAFLHNASTVAFSASSTRLYLDDIKKRYHS